MGDLTIYQVDAFAEKVFEGNPAAVIMLEKWLSENVMQNIAIENNLSETAFIIKEKEHYHIRWFTPGSEVDLCGHATLASAHVLFNHLGYHKKEIVFNSRSGILKVNKKGDFLTLDFPIDKISKIDPPENLLKAFNKSPIDTYKGRTDYLLIFKDEAEIAQMSPDLSHIKNSGARGVIISAKGDNVDFVSRFFAPLEEINEDPVTGSAHTTLMPYWSNVFGKNELEAHQISNRGGKLKCKLDQNRVYISGKTQTYMIGKITASL